MIIFLTIEITLLQNVLCLKIKEVHTKTTHRWIQKVIPKNAHQVKNLSAKSIFKSCIVGQVIDMETASCQESWYFKRQQHFIILQVCHLFSLWNHVQYQTQPNRKRPQLNPGFAFGVCSGIAVVQNCTKRNVFLKMSIATKLLISTINPINTCTSAMLQNLQQ